MSSQGGEISHVSDTALMVAACRAQETELDDAFVRDPFAARLAGERGVAILNAMPHANVMRFGMAIRTRFLDELLMQALAEGDIGTVLSVGCGLDTRPWRLGLPKDLRWVEIDFPDMLDYKEQMMSGEKLRCHRERLSVDVTEAAGRQRMWDAAKRSRTLMITEGLLMYLPAAAVNALALESSEAGVAEWISDITTTAFSEAIGAGKDSMKSIRHVQATDSLTGEQIFEVIRRHGWRSAAHRSYIRDVGFAVERIRRMTGGKTPPPPPPEAYEDVSGVHRFER